MSRVVQRRWVGNPDALSRQGRMPCDYEAYVPDPLLGRMVTLDGGVAADVADAETAITRLDVRANTLADTEGLARLLLRAESVASSRIEGLEVGARKLLRTEAARQLGERTTDLTAAEVLSNINAMNAAVRELGPGDPISPDTLLGFHHRLMANSRFRAQAGRLREQQNWIGGSEYNPCAAAFVPPPPELVPGLIDDLCAFCNDDSLPAVAQAALAHAQFETIHPFADGNGRTGRGLIHLVLRRRGLATRVLPPVSLVLATWAKDYVDGLTATRYTGPATGDAARTGLNRWIGTFAGACARAAGDADSFEDRVEQIEASWRAQVGRIRSGSATDLLLRALPGAPVLSVSGAAELTGRSYPQVNEAIGRLASAGVLAQISVGKRNRAFEAKDIINAFGDLERQLASPAGDTRNSQPARPVPRRRPTLSSTRRIPRGIWPGNCVWFRVVGVDAEITATSGVHGFVPVLTSFVGRAGDVRKLDELLGEYRLVTVTGPGGVGKTRLACEVARLAAARFADGVWLVELSAVRDPAQVPAAVAAVLGVSPSPDTSPSQALADVLSRRQLLLVLDNCEHVLGAAAELCGLMLPSADDVTVLATSREPLGIAGETRYRLGPLPLPGPDPAGQGPASASVQLFAERARQADPSFGLAGETIALVHRLVTRLDGMPLAIELAAARLEALGLPQLLDRLHLLAGGDRRAPARQQSLAAAIGWSYQLLTEDMRQAFRQLAIFPGPFSLDAAEDVIGAGAGAAVVHLVDCSLLTPPRPGPDGGSRYAMLETIRAYGRERLAEAGEEPGSAAALARYALTTSEVAAAGLQTSTGELAAARRLDAEATIVEQALAWSLEYDHATAPRLAAALAPWWLLRGRPADAGRMLRAAAVFTDPGSHLWCRLQNLLGEAAEANSMEQALAHYAAAGQAAADGGPSPVLADALVGQAHSLVNLFRLDEGAELARAGLAMSRELGYVFGEANSLFTLGEAAFHGGRSDDASSWFSQADQADPAHVPGWLNRASGLMLANVLRRTDDRDAALRTCVDVLSRAAAVDDVPSQMMAQLFVADLERQAGRTEAGAAHLGEAVRLLGRTGSVHNLPDCLEICGHLGADRGRWADAVSAWSAATALLRASGRPVSPLDAAARQPSWRKAEQALGPAQLQAADQRGTRMPPDAAAEFALVLAMPDPRAEPEQADMPQLSARERELITLVAQGRTDAQIAAELYIAVATVRSHLDRIRDKTSCRRRADLTRLALRAGLV